MESRYDLRSGLTVFLKSSIVYRRAGWRMSLIQIPLSKVFASRVRSKGPKCPGRFTQLEFIYQLLEFPCKNRDRRWMANFLMIADVVFTGHLAL